jgi:hypothetical protein
MTLPAKCNAHLSDQSRCCSAVRQACISRFIASGHSARAVACTAALLFCGGGFRLAITEN